MRLKTERALALVLWLAAALISLWAHFHLSAGPMATHFDAAGHANGYMPRDIGLSVAPGIMLALIVLLLWFLPAILPKATSIDRFEGVYGLIVLATLAVLTLTHILLVVTAAGLAVDHIRIVMCAVGLLFMIIGNYLPKTRRNWLMGLRNPWTLSDDRVWERTHRFAGPLFMLSGATVVADALLAPTAWRLPVLLAAALIPAIAATGYAYLSARRLGLV